MPAPAAGVLLLKLAETALASAVGTVAGELLYDALTGQRLLTIDPDTDEVLDEPIDLQYISMSNPSISIRQLATDPDAVLKFDVKDSDDLVASFELSERAGMSQAQVTAANKTMNSLARNEHGASLLAELPGKVEEARDAQSNEAQYDSSDSYNKKAVAKSKEAKSAALTDDTKKKIRQEIGNQDRSRISKEYHEWKYTVLESGDTEAIQAFSAEQGFAYAGSDYIEIDETNEWACPYYRWIQHDELRELHKIYRRYKRLRGRCGGKALWEEQGHASKRAAIASDCENDSEWDSLRTTLVLDDDWVVFPVA